MHIIKADFKKISYLQGYRNVLLATAVLSILFGMTFLFTTNVTTGKSLSDLSWIEIMDITLLGIDVTTIMFIIFTAYFIANEFASGTIYTSLAITPLRQKYFLCKLLFIAKISILSSIILTCALIFIAYVMITMNNIDGMIWNSALMIKLFGVIIMPMFYSLLSLAGTFYTQTASGGIAFALAVMFTPALIKMFPANVSDVILPIFPEHALHVFTEIHSSVDTGLWLNASVILLLWIAITSILSYWRFNKSDF